MIRVNDEEISEATILLEMQYHPASSHDEAYYSAARCLTIGAVLRQRAQALGMDEQADGNGDYLDAMIEQEVDYPVATEQECRQYYRANPAKFCRSPLVAARHILVAADRDDTLARSEALTLAEKLIDILQARPGDFSELARRHSDCDSAKEGGQLGQLSRGQTVDEFERHVLYAEPGLFPRPIETRYGFHVVYIDQHIDGELLPYEQVAERIHDYLDKRVERKAVAQYIDMLLSEAEIEGLDISSSNSPLMQ